MTASKKGAARYEQMAQVHVADLFNGAPKPARPVKKERRKQITRKELPPSKMPRPEYFQPIACPCCNAMVSTPTLEIVVDHYRVPPTEQAILRTVWKAKGRPVPTERIFDAMYADDPDGGPAPGRMYAAFKACLHNLRCRLAGSGVSIENTGYRQGYRLVLGKH
ncbi:MAG: hypothetical protein KYX69_19755 [Sphingomonas sp.]|uniref:hypothetical protein n=1 Tax=Sphingomonas sp. TaxID=28214 RepID=UPI00261790C5|nr:hypothetical protein [Sphingomonas sp.]MDK2769940.1 hypothetical protein [Sphingomonas sp.]